MSKSSRSAPPLARRFAFQNPAAISIESASSPGSFVRGRAAVPFFVANPHVFVPFLAAILAGATRVGIAHAHPQRIVGGGTRRKLIARLIEHTAACAIDKDWVDRRSGLGVDEPVRDAVSGEMAIAKGRERNEDRPEVTAFFGENVFVTGWMLGVLAPLQQACLDQGIQAPRQHIGCDLEARLELVKARQAVEGVAQNENAPPLAHAIKRPRDWAEHVPEGLLLHGLQDIGQSLAEC